MPLYLYSPTREYTRRPDRYVRGVYLGDRPHMEHGGSYIRVRINGPSGLSYTRCEYSLVLLEDYKL